MALRIDHRIPRFMRERRMKKAIKEFHESKKDLPSDAQLFVAINSNRKNNIYFTEEAYFDTLTDLIAKGEVVTEPRKYGNGLPGEYKVYNVR